MMTSPIFLRGRVVIKNEKLSVDHLRNYIVDSLLMEEAQSNNIVDGAIHFKVGCPRPFWSWKLLVGMTEGIISFNNDQKGICVTYKVVPKESVYVATFFVSILIIFNVKELLYEPNKLACDILVWFLLVCGNMLIDAFRFPSFIRRCASEAADQVYYWDKK